VTSDSPRAVGWIGLGEMGVPMSVNLVRAGHVVIGYDLNPDALAAAAGGGVRPAESLAGLVADADVLITMVRTGAQTEALLFGEGGLVALGARDRDVIVMSTMDPETIERLAEAGAEAGLTLIDAPVSGGVRGAEAATLSIMASGPPDALDRAAPVLEVLGAQIHRVGDRVGAGQAAKLANQVMMAAAIAGSYEGLALARSYGVADEKVIAAVGGGTGASWPLAHWDWMRSLWEDYEPDNALDILEKDLRAVLAAIAGRDVEMPVTDAVGARLMDLWARARSE
jgi:3-hydroxyisobutyrate dehydrogenase-like beta-hydroxyacid dehydrogenase